MGMMLLIVLATVCFVLESEATIETGGLYETDALVRDTDATAVDLRLSGRGHPPRNACAAINHLGAAACSAASPSRPAAHHFPSPPL